IEIIRSGKVRRSKLYYLRGKTSKKDTKIQSADEDKTQSKA
ncbi:MAG: 50S ribosomal protein L19, partial [Candidatus Omnitrophota bacterium]